MIRMPSMVHTITAALHLNLFLKEVYAYEGAFHDSALGKPFSI